MSKKSIVDVTPEARRHSCAHLLAGAVLDIFPEAKFAIGPAIENGFYYDFELPRTLIPEDLPLIEKRMRHVTKQNIKFEKYDEPIDQALKFLHETKQNYKAELVSDLKKQGTETVSFYKSGNFVDLCKGPHVEHSGQIGAFKLTHIAGAYWRGDEKRPMLQRIYGIAFPTEEELKTYLQTIEEAKKRDHRELGKKLDLFSFHEAAPGATFWHPRGKFIFDAVVNFMRKENDKRNYTEVATPIVLSSDLWKKSGHYENFKENMYFTEFEKREFAVKPMNCPGGCLLFAERSPSYRELPIKMSEFGIVHRLELSGVLHGLLRVRQFTQDDAHVYCAPEQLEEQILEIVNYTLETYRSFGFTEIKLFLATRPEKSIGSDENWEKATTALENAVKKTKLDCGIKAGEGAFYGPKIEFNVKDALGRNWQLGTCQIDFNLPVRFGLQYVGSDGNKHEPAMIHRAIVGSIERFLGILIEHTAGALPTWLAPEQVRILPVSEHFFAYADQVLEELKNAGWRTTIDKNTESLGKKIRSAELMKIPYMLVVGEKETQEKTVTVRDYATKKQEVVELEKLAKQLLK